jgi:hypothetical protein
MTVTKELLHEAIEGLDDANLDEVYVLIKQFYLSSSPRKKMGLLSKLQRIQIDGPEDFAANSDAYVLGEKHA